MASIVTIQNRQSTRRVNTVLLRRITWSLLADELGLVEVELGINLVGDAEMTRINEGFLHHEGSTDVITFDYAEPGTRNSKTGTVGVQGEILVCVDEAIRQAKRFKTSWQSEIVRYVVHGVLHLLGHDDKRAKPRQKMKREENRLVSRVASEYPIADIDSR